MNSLIYLDISFLLVVFQILLSVGSFPHFSLTAHLVISSCIIVLVLILCLAFFFFWAIIPLYSVDCVILVSFAPVRLKFVGIVWFSSLISGRYAPCLASLSAS